MIQRFHVYKPLLTRTIRFMQDWFALLFVLILSPIALYNFINTPNSLSAATVPINSDFPYQETNSLFENITDSTAVDRVILHGSRFEPKIALTFDAEMTEGMKNNLQNGTVKNSYDNKILEILNQTQTPATFFLTGMWTQLYPNQARDFAQNPLFEIESHSYADTSYDGYCYGLTQVKDSQDLEQIQSAQKIISDTTGVTPKYFRFPGGCYSQNDLDIVTKKAGLQVVHWDVAGDDGFNYDTQQIISNVVNHVQDGSIIVLHMNGEPTAPRTADALLQIIPLLKAKGFTFVTVSDLLNAQ